MWYGNDCRYSGEILVLEADDDDDDEDDVVVVAALAPEEDDVENAD